MAQQFAGWAVLDGAYRHPIAFDFLGREIRGEVVVPVEEVEAAGDPLALLLERTDEVVTHLHDAPAP